MKKLEHYPLLFSSDHDRDYMNEVDDLVIYCDDLRMFHVKKLQETATLLLNGDDLNFDSIAAFIILFL